MLNRKHALLPTCWTRARRRSSGYLIPRRRAGDLQAANHRRHPSASRRWQRSVRRLAFVKSRPAAQRSLVKRSRQAQTSVRQSRMASASVKPPHSGLRIDKPTDIVRQHREVCYRSGSSMRVSFTGSHACQCRSRFGCPLRLALGFHQSGHALHEFLRPECVQLGCREASRREAVAGRERETVHAP